MNNLHGILFAYRSDPGLGELTRPRNTCSLLFGGRYRLIDFMLSNYVNAGITDVGVIVHEAYQSLLSHLGSGKDWDLSRKRGGLRLLPPFGYAGQRNSVYRGSMEALSRVPGYLSSIRQDYVVLAWGDLAVNIDLTDVFAQHLRTGADITLVCTNGGGVDPQLRKYAETDGSGRITGLSVHPTDPGRALESLEVYILSKQLLLDLVDYCAAHDVYSLSRGALRPRLERLTVLPYMYSGYVGRFQTVDDYYRNSMDLLKPEVRADLFCPERPIRTRDHSSPSTYYGPESVSRSSLVADGCYIEGQVLHSIIGRGVTVEAGAKVSHSILMQGTLVRAGAELTCVIADKNVRINENRMLVGHSTYPLVIAKNAVV